MNCRIAHELLQQSLDGAPIESPEWLEHLRSCGDCRALASAGRRLQTALRLLPSPLPPPDLAERIAEHVRLDRRRVFRRKRQRWAVSLALAASLFVALALRLDWRTDGVGRRVGPMDAGNSPSVATRSESGPTLRESAAELGAVFTALQNQTADETVGQARRWVASVPSPALPKVDLASMAPPSHPLREAGEGVSDGLQPLTNSARRAVDLFLRELPMEEMTN